MEIRQHYTRACWGFYDCHPCLEHEFGLVQKKSIKEEEVWLIVAISHTHTHTHTVNWDDHGNVRYSESPLGGSKEIFLRFPLRNRLLFSV